MFLLTYMFFFVYISSYTGRIISAKDHASVQINVADVSCMIYMYLHLAKMYHKLVNIYRIVPLHIQ